MKLPGVPSLRDIASCKQAHWFTHFPKTSPSSSFHDSYFHDILTEMFSPNNITDNIRMLNEMIYKYMWMLNMI